MILQEQLIRDEGCKLSAYVDTLGNWTVGVGHKVDSDVGTITQDQADVWLALDIAVATKEVASAIPWTTSIDDVRCSALVNICFNIGIGHLLGFHHALGYMQSGDWQNAATELLNSTWALQVGVRAKRLAFQVITGEMQ